MSAAAAEARLHTLLLIELLSVLGNDEGNDKALELPAEVPA